MQKYIVKHSVCNIKLNKMKIQNIRMKFAVLIALIIFTLPGTKDACAQSQWLDYGDGNSVSIEFCKPFLQRDSLGTFLTPGFSALSGALFITGRYNVTKNVTLVGEIPLVNGKFEYDDDDLNSQSESGIKFGNPYIGGEYALPKSPLFFELGLRIPVVQQDPIVGTLVGVRADIDRSEAFFKDIVPVYGAVNFKTVTESNILFKLRAGGNVWFNARKLGFDSPQVFSVDYTLQTGYVNKRVNILLGLTGRYDSDSGPQYPDKYTFLQYGLMITVPYKNFRPSFSVRVPGEDADKFFNYVVAFNLTYGFE